MAQMKVNNYNQRGINAVFIIIIIQAIVVVNIVTMAVIIIVVAYLGTQLIGHLTTTRVLKLICIPFRNWVEPHLV